MPEPSWFTTAHRRRNFYAVSLVVWALQASGCEPPDPPAVVWMNDSSGFVSNSEEFFDVATGVRSEITLPKPEQGFTLCGANVHPGLKRTVVVARESNAVVNQASQLAVWVYDGITTPPAKPATFTVKLSASPALPLETELHQSPTGEHLLVCSLENAVIVDLKTERTVQVMHFSS